MCSLNEVAPMQFNIDMNTPISEKWPVIQPTSSFFSDVRPGPFGRPVIVRILRGPCTFCQVMVSDSLLCQRCRAKTSDCWKNINQLRLNLEVFFKNVYRVELHQTYKADLDIIESARMAIFLMDDVLAT